MSVQVLRRIGDRYSLLEPIGRGGMGTVWRSRDELLGRLVAVKEILPPPGLTPEEQAVLSARTLREARAAARITSRRAVTVYDVVEQDGRPWIVMELLDSRSLADVLRDEGPLPPGEVARIGLAVLDALEAAHRVGVIHRDVKPANVLLAADGRIVLTDFGIAALDGDPTLTTTATVLGSPAYMAPERAHGHEPSPAMDLWSLGATMYAALDGRSPFQRTSALTTLRAVLMDPLPPVPALAGPLTPVLQGLLEKDPQRRIDASRARTLLGSVATSAGNGDAVSAAPPVLPPPAPAPSATPDAATVPPATGNAGSSQPGPSAPVPEPPAPVQAAGSAPVEAIPVEPEPVTRAEDPAPSAEHAAALRVVDVAAAERVAAVSAVASAGSAAPLTSVSSLSPATLTVREVAPASTAPAVPAAPEPAGPVPARPVPARPVPAGPDGPGRATDAPVARPNTAKPGAVPGPDAVRVERPPVPSPIPARTPPPRLPAGATAAPARRGRRAPVVLLAALLTVAAVAGLVAWYGRTASTGGGSLAPSASGGEATGAGQPPAAMSPPVAPLPATTPGPTPTTGSASAQPSLSASAGAASTKKAAAAPAATSSAPKPSARPASPEPRPSSPSPSPSPSTSTTSPAEGAPAGFTRYRDATGFSIAVPNGWRKEKRGHVVYFVEPGGGRFLHVDQSSHPKSDPVADWRAQESGVAARSPGYRRISIGPVAYRGWKAADWEYTWRPSGGQRHVRSRNIVTGPNHAYALYFSVPESRWGSSQGLFQTFARTFQPAS